MIKIIIIKIVSYLIGVAFAIFFHSRDIVAWVRRREEPFSWVRSAASERLDRGNQMLLMMVESRAWLPVSSSSRSCSHGGRHRVQIGHGPAPVPRVDPGRSSSSRSCRSLICLSHIATPGRGGRGWLLWRSCRSLRRSSRPSIVTSGLTS